MSIFEQALNSKISFYNTQIDVPHSVNGFKGTWNISDHSLIPGVFNDFLLRYFQVNRLSRIPLVKINKLLNEVWEGPGSLEKIFRMEYELRGTNDIKFPARPKTKEDDETAEEELDDVFVLDLSAEDTEDED